MTAQDEKENNNNENEHVNVLLVGTPLAEVDEIEKELGKTIDLECHLSECPDLTVFLDDIEKQISGIDIILLDLAWADSADSEIFFKTIQETAPDMSVVVFTREEDRPLALFMLNKGASEVRSSSGKFKIKPNRLGDLVEDSWARHKNTQEKAEESATALKEEQASSAKELKEERIKSAEDLKEEKEKGAEKLKQKDQVISWLSGGYSLERLSD